MEQLALGTMGMTETELQHITPRALFNKINGFRAIEKEAWERTRAQSFIAISVHLEKGSTLTPQELMPFPWDNELKEFVKIDAKQLAANRKALWEKHDREKASLVISSAVEM